MELGLNDAQRTLVLLGLVLSTMGSPAFALPSLPIEMSKSGQHPDVPQTGDSPPSLRQPPIADAIVDRYLLHPLGDVEGLLLRDGLQMHVTLRAAQELVTIIQPGDRVRVHGRRHAELPVAQADVIINVTDGRSLTVPFRLDYPIPPAERRQTLRAMTASGSIETLLYDYQKGIVKGVVLSDGTQVRLPPDVGERFRSSLQPHLDVEVEGYGTETQYGRSLEATAIGRKDAPLTHLDASTQELR